MTARLRTSVLTLAALVALAGCAPQGEPHAGLHPGSAPPAANAVAGWPRTVTVAGATAVLDAAPQRIVAVTSETADLVLQLVGPERVVAIAPASLAAGSGAVPELAARVPNVLPAGTDPDPELVLSYGPDLVVSTGRHGGEKAAGQALAASGVPTLTLDQAAFGSPDALAATIRTLAEALGAEGDGARLADRLESDLAAADAQRGAATPRVLPLMARGRSVMAIGRDNMLPALVARAGGRDAAASVGIERTTPVDAEVLAKINPDVLLLEDFQGQGEAPFRALLDNPAVAQLDAVKNGRVHLIPMTEASALSGLRTPEGYRRVVDLLNRAG